MPATIKSAIPGSPAEKAGLVAGDSIVSIDGVPISTWSEMGAVVNSSNGKALSVDVKNAQGEMRTVKLTPAIPAGSPDKIAKIGAMLETGKLTPEQKAAAFVKIDRGARQAMEEAASRCAKMTKLTFTAIGSMFSGRSGSENISGPVGIAKQAGEAADNGAQSFLGFLAFLSLSLFIMNLLPLPALDGGHLVLFALEAIMGRPLSVESQARFGQVGFSLLAGLMLFALYNDISKLFH
jgi:regulator of sigma E protease